MSACLAEDDLLELTRGRPLGDAPELEAHLADCASCSALLAALLATEPRDGEPAPPRWGALVGRSLGPYRLEAQIGAGGMGVVYRAWDERLGRNVAVKVLPVHATGSAELARRLATEARAAAAITHPNVVTIHDVGSEGGVTFVVQELVEGETLRSVLERGPVARARVLELGLELARGLAAAHAQGVVHRDLKPENLLVSADGTLKILDFGLAKLGSDGGDVDATAPGTVQGTVGYMAPEQARGEPADARSDLFAVGAILYELSSGRRAFDGASHAERLSALLRDTPVVDAAALGPAGGAIARCLEKDPRRRFQSAHDLAWVLEGLRAPGANAAGVTPAAALPAPPAPRARGLARRTFLLGGAAAAALAGTTGFLLGRGAARRGTAVPPAQPRFTQLTYRQGRVVHARFTRDGATVLYGAAWEGGPLAAYALRLGGGVARPLEVPGADVLAVSARGEVALCIGRRQVGGQASAGQLATVPLDGGVPRPLVGDVQEADFTPDGGELALVRRGGRGHRLELPAGHVLLEVPGWLTHPRISPDGARVACLQHPSTDDDRGDLIVIERASGRARTVSSGWSSLMGLAWDPGGDRLWFTGARVGASNAVHTVTLAGNETLVAQTTGRLRLHDVSEGRKIAVSHDVWRLRTVVGRPGASVAGDPDRSLSEFSMVTDLSADGRSLLIGEFGDVEAANGAYLRPVDGGPPLHVGPGFPLALSPDGARVAAVLPGQATPLVVYSTRNADQPVLALGPIAGITSARWIDERQLIVEGAAVTGAPRLWRVAVGDAAPVPLSEEGRSGPCALDPARRRAAFVDNQGQLTVIDLVTFAARTLPGRHPGLRACAWLTDGDSIVLRGVTTPIRLTRVDPTSGAATPYLEIAPPPVGLKAVDSFVLRADGELYAYSYGQELSQLYLMSLDAPGEPMAG